MAVGDAHVFPGFLTPVLTQLFFAKPPTTFRTCFCRGERRKYAGKKLRLNRRSNSQPPGRNSGGKPLVQWFTNPSESQKKSPMDWLIFGKNALNNWCNSVQNPLNNGQGYRQIVIGWHEVKMHLTIGA